MNYLMRASKRSVIKTAICAFCAAVLTSSIIPQTSAFAADWPRRNVKLVVPAKPGGGTDAVARIFTAELQKRLGKPFVVVNQPTGGGSVAAETARNARPDGYTLLYYHTGLLSSYHSGLYDHNPAEEFTTVAVMPVKASYCFAVGANSEFKTIADVVAKAKANPDKITLGVQLKGASHFMAGLLMMDSKAPFRIVEAGSDADKFVALQGGNIDMAIVNTAGAAQYQEAGKLRILGTMSSFPGRDATMPDIPSMDEQGFPNTIYGLDFFVLAPKGMDEKLAAQINAAFKEVILDKTVADKLLQMRMPLSYLSLQDSEKRMQESEKKVGVIAGQIGLK
ncbi:tripartite tricarboxylate transporter substrate binding protein [uncultured Cohaesibacter sp.]|uniref:Bug family tripartite tricarboxylate transporter substrate binding protein n=1 Tax=uncultured Cohaesibacter sp. TaxID=1002546 RepID=UPI0029C691EB|nr:tripartite tricarboxylate transporter substrate binding protein [uncultured Cohaesibacter sp.]